MMMLVVYAHLHQSQQATAAEPSQTIIPSLAVSHGSHKVQGAECVYRLMNIHVIPYGMLLLNILVGK